MHFKLWNLKLLHILTLEVHLNDNAANAFSFCMVCSLTNVLCCALFLDFLQDARKGVLFIDFPPVLQLQLKRFEYDFMRDIMVKVSN